ncbi:FdhF/YdeP family oxidoreductase [Pseudobacteriovorax antillogorgiicola]|uniref:Oxidoreductase alpha (Molybdopterin) subunit n=1 Tax=Pseudobacteriovorax antillogorgiicola TaxID=1513793 RepID=A0A1Y6CFH9_9BACT|nr:FdhF/YdeP family oxidoreductase [Pseudobacteriovorax antillogorgiicola]TCS47568.1 molybdopterin-dependent oxidoreductase alpha subunit [Pseudobacteriovorax antillogorgiicola]SMF60488.1 oxidoreductase alpha (molybdopterin) subunit [Pseudobacteriovorax antillogorgiicola]
MKNKRQVCTAPIISDHSIHIKQPGKRAGGWPAVLSSQKFLWREVGLLEGNRLIARMNQRKGFDCPGCAWPDPDGKRSFAEFCENGAKALAEEATYKMLHPEFFKAHSVEELSQLSDYQLGQLGRIEQPMVLKHDSNHYQAISWEEAFAMIAARLRELASPHRAVFYTSGRTSNEAAFLYQLMAKAIGTNNLPDCSNLCHESSGTALNQSIGIGKGTVKLEDFDKADLILVIGQNPGTNHPRMLSALQQAVKNGAHIVSINPLFEAGLKAFQHPQHLKDMLGSGTPLANKHIPIRINGDRALFQGLAKAILEKHPQGLDPDFILDSCEDFGSWAQEINRLSWQVLEEVSGVSQNEIHQLAQQIMSSKAVISCWAMGLTQQPDAVATIRELCNLHLLGGFIGKPGSGLCPVRGHSNVQGNRTVGIYEKPSSDFVGSLEKLYGLSFPKDPGYDVVDSIKAMIAGDVDVLISMGGNFLSASPDTELTAQGLRKLELSVQISTKLNRSHLITGREALILPCLARSELDIQGSGPQFVTVENSMGFVHRSEGQRKPLSEHWRSEVAIVCQLSYHCLDSSQIPWLDYEHDYKRIRDDIGKVLPDFGRYDELVRQDYGFYLTNPPRDKRSFKPELGGKASFAISPLQEWTLNADEFILMTIRSHDQYNTTIYGLDDRYRGIYQGRRVLFMNPDDMDTLGLTKNEELDITSHFKKQTRVGQCFRVIPYDIPRRCLAAYFPEANVLVPLESYAAESQTPTSKFIKVTLERSGS